MDKIAFNCVVFCMLMVWNMFILGVGGYFVVVYHAWWVVIVVLILGVDPFNFETIIKSDEDDESNEPRDNTEINSRVKT
ncbi:MAG TPA: hypothetical protein PLP75_04290 [Burkholderiales bacterium]|nr:hypothetical protein [Burkholderiales bacterium]